MQDSRRTDGEVRMTGTPRAGQRTRCKGGFALNTAATRKESVLNSARARRRVCNRIWRNRYIYLMVIPVLIYMLLLKYLPMYYLRAAFYDYKLLKGFEGSKYVGFKWFERLLSSPDLWQYIRNTLTLNLLSLAIVFPAPLVFAILLNEVRSNGYKKVVQTVSYMPHFVSTVVLVSMILQIFNPILGIYGKAYSALFGTAAPDLLGSPAALPHIYVWSGIWQSFGWDSIIYVAALAAVSPELHEAAQIDGASRFQRVLHVDLPAILPTATIMLILRTGKVMSIGFEKIFLLQNDLNLTTSEVISTYVYKVSLKASVPDFSYSTAIDLFNSVINLFLICTVNFISGRISETSLW